MRRLPTTLALPALLLLFPPMPLSAQDDGATAPAAPEVPAWRDSMLGLEVHEDLLEEGIAYHLTRGQDTQVTVTLSGELFRTVVQTSEAAGFLIGPFDVEELEAGESPISAGALRIPSASLLSHSDSDGLLQSAFLASAQHPDIGFVVDRVDNVRRREGASLERTVYDLTLHGTMALRGRAVPLSFDAVASFLLTTDDTFSRFLGDVLVLESSFELPIADLGLELPPQLAGRFGERARIDLFLGMGTADPSLMTTLMPPETPGVPELQSRYVTLLEDRGQPVEAYRVGEELLRLAAADAGALAAFARAAAGVEAEVRFGGQARRAAERAIEVVGDGEDPGRVRAQALATLGRLEAENGDLERAVELLEQATSGLEGGAGPELRQVAASAAADLALCRELLGAGSTP